MKSLRRVSSAPSLGKEEAADDEDIDIRFELPLNDEALKALQVEFPDSTRLFRVIVNVGGLPLLIHGQDTVALRFCGPRMNDFASWLGRQQVSFIVVTFSANILGLLAITGALDAWWGYPAFLLTWGAVLFSIVPRWNWGLIRVVLRTFDFWSQVVLALVGFAGLIDGFRGSPGRMCACLGPALALISIAAVDNRSPAPQRASAKARRVVYANFAILCYSATLDLALILMYYLGQLADFQQRLVPLPAGLVLDFQSISMSCFTTYFFLLTRYAVAYWRSPNTLLQVKARIEYVPIIQGTYDSPAEVIAAQVADQA